MDIVFDQKKLSIVPIETVRPNKYNPKAQGGAEFEKVKKSVKDNGLRIPIIVRENNGLEIIDGQQRYTAATELGFKEVLVYNEGKLSDNKSKQLTIYYQQQVPFDEVELAPLVNELATSGLSLPYTDAELAHYKELAGFSLEDYDDEYDPMLDSTDKLIFPVTKEQKDYITSVLSEIESAQGVDTTEALVGALQTYQALKDKVVKKDS